MNAKHTEEELHEIYDRMLKVYDSFKDNSIFSNAKEFNRFLQLYRLHGSQDWLWFYEWPPDKLMRLVLTGFESAIGLPSLSDPKGELDVTEILARLTQTDLKPESVRSEKIDPTVASKTVPMLLAARCLRVISICLIQYRVPITSLIVEAIQGDMDAFLDLVKLDSAFIRTPYGQRFIAEAELAQDNQFKAALSDALRPDPEFWSLKGERNFYALFMLFILDDFAHRPNSEWADFLSEHGFENFADTENVRRARSRYGLRIVETPVKSRSKPKKKHRTKK